MGNIGSIDTDCIHVSPRRGYDVDTVIHTMKTKDTQFMVSFGTVTAYDEIKQLFVSGAKHTLKYNLSPNSELEAVIQVDDSFELELDIPDWVSVTWDRSPSIPDKYQHLADDASLNLRLARRPKEGEAIKAPWCCIISLVE